MLLADIEASGASMSNYWICKPPNDYGGAGITVFRGSDPSFLRLIRDSEGKGRQVVQRYLAEVRQGDKRIILVDGEPMGAVNRVPAEGESRSNLHVGGTAVHADLTEREREICAAIGPALRERGLIFVGIDVIGDYLTEINVTSPTGIQEIGRLSGVDLAAAIWDAIERKR